MKTFQKKFVALTAVAGLAVLGAACEAEGGDAESPAVTEPADDTVVNEGDTVVEGDEGTEGDAGLEGDTELEGDAGLEGDTETETTE